MDDLFSLFAGNSLSVHTLDFTSSLPSGFTHSSNDAVKTYRDSSGQMQSAAANTAIFDHDSNGSALGLQCFESRTNKCTNTNVNPTTTSGLTKSGDAASVLSIASDSTALTAAKLDTLCTNDNAIELDNSSGSSTATVTISGSTGNTNPHSFSVYVRMVSGSFGTAQLTGGAPGTASFNSTSYTHITSDNITPSGTTVQMKINVAAGSVIRFVLNQLEEGKFSTPPIVVAGASAPRAKQFTQYAGFNTQPWWNPAQGTIIVQCQPALGTGQANPAGILVAGSSGSNPTDAFYLHTNSNTHIPIAYGREDNSTYSITTYSGLITGRQNSIGMSYKNGVEIRGFAGPMATRNTAASMINPAENIVDITIGSFAANVWHFNGWISKALFCKKAISLKKSAPFSIGSNTGHTERGIMCGGQSNMEGYFLAPSVLTNGGERTGNALLDSVWGTSTRNWLINGATAGTSISDWQTVGTAIEKWKAIAAAFVRGGGTIEGIVWDQGESNMGNSTASFKSDYLGIFNDMRTYLESVGQGDVNICIQPLGRYLLNSSTTHNTNCSYLRQAQQELAAENSFICIAPEKSLHPLVDTVHLTDVGYQLAANLTLRKLLDFNGESISGGVDGSTIGTPSRSGTTVTIPITHDTDGTDFTPTSAIGGFQFYDDGSKIAFTSVVRTNATTLTGTLASTPSGTTKELWHCWGSIYDDDGSTLTRDNSSNNLPLRAGKFTLS